jgi:serine/threonine-protein kinase
MKESPLPGIDDLAAAAALWVEQQCTRFENAWKACQDGPPPVLEDHLAGAEEPVYTVLLRELLHLDLTYRGRRGADLGLAEYLRRFPGHKALLVEVFEAVAPSRPEPPPGAAGGAGPITLTVTHGPHRGQQFRLTGHDTFIVGRSRRAHLRLPEKDANKGWLISRLHFLVEANPPRCRVLDLGSRNGTHVNGTRVDASDLHDGDRIQAGRTVLHVAIPAEAEPAAPAPAPPPAASFPVVPGHEIVREIGRGAMGVVYLARDLARGDQVAVKTITPSARGKSADVERFLREARILCDLVHPHVVACRELGESQGRLYFVMEYVAGQDAAGLLKERGPLPAGLAVGLVCQLLQALDYTHARGKVHRDIKPANLLIAQGGTVKLADFGLARVYQESPLSGLTVTGMVGGTVAFMAPEQITDFRNARPPADLYATAATLYNLLTGCHVHDLPRGEMQKAFAIILHDDPIPVRARRPDLPAELAAVIHRGLRKEPGKRFASALDMHRALQPFATRA